ncbi:hypothetical protein B0J14DRAFT_361426 [Halenospora varia]|nr:hypothetical protein B0J14DRAFT_361426 [Halenospora varia]
MSLWCFECVREFCNGFALYQHCRDTGHQEAFECLQYDDIFGAEQELRNHENFAHPKSFSCPLCARSFDAQGSLRSHHNSAHKHGCLQCARHFNTASAREAHDNDVRPFPCLSCGQAFRTEGLLQAHEQETGHNTNAPTSLLAAPTPQTHECHNAIKCSQMFLLSLNNSRLHIPNKQAIKASRLDHRGFLTTPALNVASYSMALHPLKPTSEKSTKQSASNAQLSSVTTLSSLRTKCFTSSMNKSSRHATNALPDSPALRISQSIFSKAIVRFSKN